MRWRGAAAIVSDIPTLSSERMLHKGYGRKCSIVKIILALSLVGAWRQYERIGVKPPVTLTIIRIWVEFWRWQSKVVENNGKRGIRLCKVDFMCDSNIQ
jgi:hypothetical protein